MLLALFLGARLSGRAEQLITAHAHTISSGKKCSALHWWLWMATSNPSRLGVLETCKSHEKAGKARALQAQGL